MLFWALGNFEKFKKCRKAQRPIKHNPSVPANQCQQAFVFCLNHPRGFLLKKTVQVKLTSSVGRVADTGDASFLY